MRIDENGNAWWHWLLGGLLVLAITVVTAGVAGIAAAGIGAALGVGTSLVNGAVIGAAIGGLVTGGFELITQGVVTNWQKVDFGALAIETFTGAAYGAAVGLMGSTTSVGLRLGMRAAIVGISVVNTALYGIYRKESFGRIMASVGMSVVSGLLIQGAMLGWDAYAGKLSSSILSAYLLDGALFVLKDKLLIAGISAIKNIFGNRNDWFRFIF